ncbi:hypothetical protein PUNSTDRAFT_63770 [Punctularia strigosozonata HHB-11173 SS5]|uniref:uncharacterized protein n=1 Tax=Punctularia strigosozonata (strain HHB-11173) TaxID=741275 RepID=UPI0004417F72|nr:uncharacterized protein PUNSTDRAFT_63770 [Punctularia strigosozonata HHB-11173 SS5]EIN10879.1 hypothetical protein PUNSTDRAFT_63770 [Punctularia strigosozonata HHB-11173 SS5]
MRSFVVALTFVASALAYAVTEPSGSQGWTTAGPNVLSWSTVSTDATNFTAVLTNEDRSIMPQNNQILDALVQGSSKSINVNPPSGGFPVGKGFRVNLVKDTDDLSTIYAQSDEFSIVQSSSTLSSTTTAQLSSASGVAASTTG